MIMPEPSSGTEAPLSDTDFTDNTDILFLYSLCTLSTEGETPRLEGHPTFGETPRLEGREVCGSPIGGCPLWLNKLKMARRVRSILARMDLVTSEPGSNIKAEFKQDCPLRAILILN
jgi:hypothetical protein